MMSVILYVLGGLAVMLGATLVGFGIPIKEFGIGNTLILAGTVTFCTGLLLVALASAVTHLARLTDLLASRAPVRDARPLEPFDRLVGTPATSTGGDGRIPFPPRPKPPGPPPIAEPGAAVEEPQSAGQSPSQSPSLAPSLRNPDLAADEGDREMAPSKPAAMPLEPPAPDLNLPPPPPLPSMVTKPAEPQMPPPPPRPAPTMRPPQPNYFDTVWPADSKAEKKPNGDGGEHRPVPRFETPGAEPPPAADVPLPEPPREEKRAAAVLKSGVVDGMAYTLYVDGSIEAELPQGTLRFASINELREHLERGGA